MKLRLSGDSLRLRLSPVDVAKLGQYGAVRSETQLSPSSSLIYELIARDDLATTRVIFDSSCIRVLVPSSTASRWTSSDEVGIYHNQPIEGDRVLKIIIEKDFECLDPAGNEPGAVFYPNPLKTSV